MSPRTVPLPRPLPLLIGLAATTVTVAGLRGVSGIVGPAFLALVLTVAVHPVQRVLRARGVPGWAGVLAALLVGYGVLVVLAVSLVVSVARFAGLLPGYRAQFADILDGVHRWLTTVGVDDAQVQKVLGSFDLGRLTSVATSLLGDVAGLTSNAFFVVALLLFLVLDASWFPRLLAQVPAQRAPLVDALVGFARGTRTYLVVSTVFGLVVAAVDVAALYVLGIPVPLLWGLLAFITNYVPNIGFVLGLVPPAVLGLLEGGPGLMLAVVVVYSVINVVIQSVIQPKMVGDAVGLSPSITFLSLVFWAFVLGPLGALLAVPLSLLVRAVLVDADPQAQWLRELISGPPSPPRRPRPQRSSGPRGSSGRARPPSSSSS